MVRSSFSWLLLARCLSIAHALPSSAVWQELSAQVEGRLYKGTPISEPCFQNFISEDCQIILKGYTNSSYRTAFFGSYVNPNWETCQATGAQCLLDNTNTSDISPTLPPRQCQLGSIPPYYIDIRKPSDIAAAFGFSKNTGVPVVVKNTGHDYEGRSSAPGSLALWTHNLKNISYNPSFVPDGCDKSQPGLTVGAGIQDAEAYDFADANNITIVGGNDPGVGISGGWVQGGGHGILTNTMGLGVDRVLQFRIVTPDGKYRTANACQNEDLFFALRGGGGGTYGVVLESTMLASPRVTVQVVTVLWNSATADITKTFFALLLENAVQWTYDGWGGAITDTNVIYANPVLRQTQSNASMAPLIEFGEKLVADGVPGAQVLVLEFPSYGAFFNTFAFADAAQSGTPLAIASRLVPRDNFATDSSRTELLAAIMNAYAVTPGIRLLATVPSSFPGDGSTSITQGWRDAIFHITVVGSWGWNSTISFRKQQYNSASSAIDFLRKITPDAAYQNEADVHEPNHEVSFWGNNYPRLLSIKRKYDPDQLLDCWHCVGWNPNSSRFRCYI